MKVKMPVIVPPQLPSSLDPITAADVVAEASLDGCRLEHADLPDITAYALSLDEMLLHTVSFAQAKLDKLSGRDVIWQHCDLSAAHCPEASLQRATFTNGRMTGWDCSAGMLKDVLFKNCKLDMANFRFCKLTRVRFEDCLLTEADFLGAALHNVTFEGCTIERTEFAQCIMDNVDLRGSQLIAVKGWQYMKGVIIDNVQLMSAAPHLANELGIHVID